MGDNNKLPEQGTNNKSDTDKRIGIAKGKFIVPADFDETDFDTEKLFEQGDGGLLSKPDNDTDDSENYDNATVLLITTIPILIPEKHTIIPCAVKIQKEENWFVATDSTTGIASQGKTLEKALLNIKQALDLYYQD